MKLTRRRALLGALLCLSLTVPAAAQRQTGTIQVLVAPDRPDWKYAAGEKVTFLIRAVRDGNTLKGVTAKYSIGPEQMPPAIQASVPIDSDPLRVDGGTMNQPGFLRCTVTIEENGHTYRGLGTAGFDPEKIQPTAGNPADFDAFWQAGKDELAAIPIDAQRTLVPELSTSKVNVYHVSLQNVGRIANGTTRIFGMLAEPKAPGKYPALLSVPGAGVAKIGPLVRQAEAGAITLAIGIHGIPLTLDAGVYPLLATGALSGYWAWGLESRDRYYYRRVYLGCLRANDYLTSLPNWDGKTLAVTGGSQGGALSIVTAGLDPRVKALAAYYPALSDVTGYLQGRAGGWPHMFRDDGPNSMRTKANIETAGYYDVVNFARRLRAPGLYAWGYNDATCPPTSMYAAYNSITAPKKLVLALQTGHNRVPEEEEIVNKWLEKFLSTGQASEEF
jgi:cephalosporin-C deacetylase-like acetyl esterase